MRLRMGGFELIGWHLSGPPGGGGGGGGIGLVVSLVSWLEWLSGNSLLGFRFRFKFRFRFILSLERYIWYSSSLAGSF